MIISASRRTDIPAYYSDWFLRRVEEGFVLVRNPFNPRQIRRVSLEPAAVDCIVFWTKNPARLIGRLGELDERGIPYYVQFTLTPYGKDVEPNLPDKNEVAATFIELSERIGKEKVVWRYDPVLITRDLDCEYHYRSFETLAGMLAGHTETCIISFVDFYAKCRTRMSGLEAREVDPETVRALAGVFGRVCREHNIGIQSCAEEYDLEAFGIPHGKCVDDRFISRITGKKIEVAKDRSQRKLCGCAGSVDIGEYNTCSHECRYCYANHCSGSVAAKRSLHDDRSPLLIGSP